MASFNPAPCTYPAFYFELCAPITLSNVEGCGKFSAFEFSLMVNSVCPQTTEALCSDQIVSQED